MNCHNDLNQIEMPEPGWVSLESLSFAGDGSFVSGDPRGKRIRIHYFCRVKDRALTAKVWFGPDTKGPPDHVHGGGMAAALDESMGAAAWIAGHSVVTAQLTINFRKMVPLEAVVQVIAWVEKVEGGKIFTRGEMVSRSGDLFCEAEALFVKIENSEFEFRSRLISKKVDELLSQTKS